MEDTGEQIMSVDFPALKRCYIAAYQEVDTWILPATGSIMLAIEDFKIDVVISLGVTQLGFLHPVFHHTSVAFGETYFYFEDEFTEFLAW